MTPVDLLEDAQLLYGRAQDHIGTFNRLNSVDAGLWQLKDGRLPDGIFTGTLILDRAVLRAMKPVISDIANNLIHALDHVAAAASRTASSGRPRNLYFPIAPDDAAYEAKRKTLEKLLDPLWLDLFAAIRKAHKSYQGYLWLLKEISNSGKHWELIAGGASALALAWNPPGERQQSIVEIPRDHFAANDHFIFWQGSDAVPSLPFQIITQHRFEGLDGAADASADSVFSTCSRFVADVIAQSRQRLDELAGS